MSKFGKIATAFLCAVCMAALAVKPETYAPSSLYGIKLWALVALPSLLPFFFFSGLLAKTGAANLLSKVFQKPCRKIFRTNGISSYVFLTSVLSGYPIGAKLIGELGERNLISKDEATKMSTFCSTSGPLFVIGSVGFGMFSSKIFGFILYFSHVVAVLTTGALFRFYGENPSLKTISPSRTDDNNVLYECAYSSVVSVAVVGGFICVFSVVADLARNLGVFTPFESLLFAITKNEGLSRGFVEGLVECTRGCQEIANACLSTYSLPFVCSIISFGGASALAQSICFLKKADANVKIFVAAKIVCAILSFAVCRFVIIFV